MASIQTRRPAGCGHVVMMRMTSQYFASSDDAVQETSSKIARGVALHTASDSGYKVLSCRKAFLVSCRENFVPVLLSRIGPWATQVAPDIKHQYQNIKSVDRKWTTKSLHHFEQDCETWPSVEKLPRDERLVASLWVEPMAHTFID